MNGRKLKQGFITCNGAIPSSEYKKIFVLKKNRNVLVTSLGFLLIAILGIIIANAESISKLLYGG